LDWRARECDAWSSEGMRANNKKPNDTCVLQQFILPVPYCSLLCMLIHYHCRAFQKCQWARENVAWIAERRMLMWLEQEIRHVGEHIILYTRMPRARVLDHLLSIVEP
jgi:hypothetical protein